MSDPIQHNRAASDQILAYLRDHYSLKELEVTSKLFNDIADTAMACDDVKEADALSIAGACISVVHDLLIEQGASQ